MTQPTEPALTSEGRREIRVESRRQLILDAAAAEFAEAGYERATLVSIGDRVGLSKASLYYYVDSKEELLLQLIERVVDDIEARAVALTAPGADPAARLRAFVRAHLGVALETPEGRLLSENLGVLMSSEAAAALRERHELTLSAILQEGISTGDFAAVQVRAVVKLAFGALNSVRLWFDPHGDLTLDDVTETVVNLLLHGLTAATLPKPSRKRKPS